VRERLKFVPLCNVTVIYSILGLDVIHPGGANPPDRVI